MAHEQAMDVVMPSGMDFAAIGAAFVAYFVLSFLWWGPIFGGKWAKEHGIDMDNPPSMAIPMVLQVIGSALVAYVLWTVMHTFAVTHDGNGLVRGDLSMSYALTGSFFTWLGFFVPVKLGLVAWEQKSWRLFGIDAGGQFVGLMAMGVVFALF